MEESIFRNLDLGNKRNEGEEYVDYKHRQKANKYIQKLYLKNGRDVFLNAFPQGIKYEDFSKVEEVETGELVIDPKTVTPVEIEKVDFELDNVKIG